MYANTQTKVSTVAECVNTAAWQNTGAKMCVPGLSRVPGPHYNNNNNNKEKGDERGNKRDKLLFYFKNKESFCPLIVPKHT